MATVDLDRVDCIKRGLPGVIYSRELPPAPYAEGSRVSTPDGQGVIVGMEGSRRFSESWRMAVLLDVPAHFYNPACYWPDELTKI
jgi:hypothetical protein